MRTQCAGLPPVALARAMNEELDELRIEAEKPDVPVGTAEGGHRDPGPPPRGWRPPGAPGWSVQRSELEGAPSTSLPGC